MRLNARLVRVSYENDSPRNEKTCSRTCQRDQNKLCISAGKRTESKTAIFSSAASERVDHAASIHVLGERTKKKLEAEKLWKEHYETNNRLQAASTVGLVGTFASTQATNLRNSRMYLSLHDVMNIEEISFDEVAKVA